MSDEQPSVNNSNGKDMDEHINGWSDSYFLKTRNIVSKFGDITVTYAVFMRRPVLFTPRLMINWINDAAKARGADIQIELNYAEGEWAGAGEP
ncbi:MAG: nicotinate phosphoribosyltransferase, partial [Rhodospirillales bacterium]|nr:nicotinate phosphoribosyltransferase [Rhodospirillales bacterium]